MLTPLTTSAVETALNRVLYQESALQQARSRLNGKVLALSLAEMNHTLYLLFNELQLDVLGHFEGDVDCLVSTKMTVLPKLWRDRQQLTALIRSGELNVEGDIQVVQQFTALLALAEWDIAEFIAPYTGDFVAYSVSKIAHRGAAALAKFFIHQRNNVAQRVTEEWRLAPNTQEAIAFKTDVEEINAQQENLAQRLLALEEKL